MCIAAAVVGGAVVSAGVSAYAAKSAASTQAGAAKDAASAQLAQFNTINSQQAPYREAGYGALSELQNRMGITPNTPQQSADNFDAAAYLKANPDVANNENWSQDPYSHYLQHGQSEGRAYTGTQDYYKNLELSKNASSMPGYGSFTHEFNADDLQANLNPNYDFMLSQGQGQTKNLANSTGGLISGNALQGLNTFTQNYAKNAYQDAFNNYTTNQNNIYSRLSNLAGLGQTSLQQSGAAGTAATNAASGYLTSAAAANAAGTVGTANAISGAANTAGTMGALYGWGG